MSTISAYLQPFLGGLLLFAVLSLRKKSASKGDKGSSLVAKWSRALGAIGCLVAAAMVLSGFADNANTGGIVLATVLGFAVPSLLKLRKSVGPGPKQDARSEANLMPGSKVAKMARQTRRPSRLELGGVPIAEDDETRHFLLAGGGSDARLPIVGQFLALARQRGDVVLVLDKDGAYLQRYFNADFDFVFNPLDARCVGWAPVLEMRTAWDAAAVARTLIADGDEHHAEQHRFAQALVALVLRRLWEKELVGVTEFLFYAQDASLSELTAFVGDIAAPGQLASQRTLDAARQCIAPYFEAYRHLPVDLPPFSVAAMVKAEHSGMLFLPYQTAQLAQLAQPLATLLDTALRTVLLMPHNHQRRIWIIAEDIAEVGTLPSLAAFIAKAGGAGGALVLSTARPAELALQYAAAEATSLASALGITLCLTPVDERQAQMLAALLVTAPSAGESSHLGVTPAQLLRMGPGSAILRMGDMFPLCSVRMKLQGPPVGQTSAFEPEQRERVPTIVTKVVAAPDEPAAAPKRKALPLINAKRRLDWESPQPTDARRPTTPETDELPTASVVAFSTAVTPLAPAMSSPSLTVEPASTPTITVGSTPTAGQGPGDPTLLDDVRSQPAGPLRDDLPFGPPPGEPFLPRKNAGNRIADPAAEQALPPAIAPSGELPARTAGRAASPGAPAPSKKNGLELLSPSVRSAKTADARGESAPLVSRPIATRTESQPEAGAESRPEPRPKRDQPAPRSRSPENAPTRDVPSLAKPAESSVPVGASMTPEASSDMPRVPALEDTLQDALQEASQNAPAPVEHGGSVVDPAAPGPTATEPRAALTVVDRSATGATLPEATALSVTEPSFPSSMLGTDEGGENGESALVAPAGPTELTSPSESNVPAGNRDRGNPQEARKDSRSDNRNNHRNDNRQQGGKGARSENPMLVQASLRGESAPVRPKKAQDPSRGSAADLRKLLS